MGELVGQLRIGLRSALEYRPRALILRIRRLLLRPPGLSPKRGGGVDEFLRGELAAGITHAGERTASGRRTSKRRFRLLYAGQSHPAMLPPRMATRDKLQDGAERLLADIREIKAALAEEDDPDEQRHLKWLVKGIHRKVTRHRVWLESLREDARASSELEAQIALFVMIEHECRANEERERPA